MKYAAIILGGGSDLPLDELGGLTPLEAADTPNLDELSRAGRIGTVCATPKGCVTCDEVCLLNLLGYDPVVNRCGHGVLEALGAGCELSLDDWAMRVSLMTIGEDGADDEGVVLDQVAGMIPEAESRVLIEDLVELWSDEAPEFMEGVRLGSLVQSGGVLLDSSGTSYRGVESAAPVDLIGRRWEPALPSGELGRELARCIEVSKAYLDQHEINQVRREQGLHPANLAWIWGMGQRRKLPSFLQITGLNGVLVTRSGVMGGIGELIGWDRLSGSTHQAMGDQLVRKIRDHDFVCWYGDGCAVASHQGDAASKVQEIEAIDREIIGPVMNMLRRYGDQRVDPAVHGWRMMVVVDHATHCTTHKHDPAAVPFAMGGAWVQSVVERTMTERQAIEADLHIERGTDLMEYFLYSGLVRVDHA
ncbi:MAG: hypothetical protein JJ974_08755 [Phycisphaerales bacterium]|nr:hypothetical protein [Phycisphaerales bacterium]